MAEQKREQHQHHWVPKREGSWAGEPSYVQACSCGATLRNGKIVEAQS